MSDNILELKKITKNFPGVKALDNACLLYTSDAADE